MEIISSFISHSFILLYFIIYRIWHFLVKVRVGCVKLSTYDLPPKDHIYGRVLPADEESAGQVISNWVASDPSIKKESESKIVYTNVLAIKNGYVILAPPQRPLGFLL